MHLILAWMAAGWSAPALAEAPATARATLQWRKQAATVSVQAGSGEHLAPEAPATLRMQQPGGPTVDIACSGADLGGGLALFRPQGDFTLVLDAVACEDGGSTCRPIQARFSGRVTGRRGQLDLAAAAAPTPTQPDASPLGDSAALAQLFVDATADGRPVLIDFSAQWCPPCNLLAAELLHDPAHQADLSGFHRIELDVDRPESWESKDRYAVGGYPTLLAARPDGVELDRLVGYPGKEAVLAWLASLATQPALGELPDPGGLSAEAAATLALRLGLAGRIDDGLLYLPQAESTPSADLDAALLLLKGDADAATRAVNQAGRSFPGDWVWSALPLARDSAPLALALKQRLPDWISEATAVQAADLLYIAGELSEAADAPTHFAAAALLLSRSLSGDPDRDRGHWTGLADLYARAGQPRAALAVLDQAVAHFPNEFTFHYARAGLLLDQGQAGPAAASARAALSFSYGDNALRAADRLAQALLTSGQLGEARAVVTEALQQARRPDPEARVRTGRYLRALEATLERIDSPGAPASPAVSP